MDVAANARALDLEEDEYLELLRLFIRTSAANLSDLSRAVDENRADQTAALAHKIKGAALNLNLPAVARHARDIETESKQGSLENVSSSLSGLKRSVEEVSSAVAGWMDKP